MTGRLRRLLDTRSKRITAVVVTLALLAAVVWIAIPAPQPAAIPTRDVTISAAGGPGVPDPVQLDATMYLPATTPAPAVIVAHGFGGSKQSVDGDAQDLARAGFVVLAYSARGFGRSTGQIGLDSLDYEIPDGRAVVDYLAQQPEVQLDGPGDPRVGVTGASYGGALSLMLAGTDPRIDASVPLITWNDLQQSLFPNMQATGADLAAGTPAAAVGVADGVFKKLWASTLMASVTTGAALSASPSGTATGDSGDSGFVRRGGGSSTASTAAAAPTGGASAGAGDAPTADAGVGADGVGADAASPSGASPGETAAAPTVTAVPDDATGTGDPGTNGSGTGGGTPDIASLAAQVGCGRMMVQLCVAYAEAAQTGRINDRLAALLERSSPKQVVGDTTAPTLLVQGERDTLFGLDQADANARAIAANGTPVAVTWYNGGHDGGSPDAATETQITDWLRYYLQPPVPAGSSGPAPPSTAFTYTVDGPLSDSGTARSRTLQAPSYPGLVSGSSTDRPSIPLTGDPQFAVNPPGASPASISTLPGLSGIASTALSTFLGGLPGQTARFRSAPFTDLTLITGTARVTVTVSRLPLPTAAAGSATGATTDDGAVLFASLAKVSEGGTRSLAGGAVSPIRLTDEPADGSPVTVTVSLPAAALQVEPGSTVEVSLSTTDQAFAGPTVPAAYRIALADPGAGATGATVTADGISAPEVPGDRVSASDIPVGQLIGLIVVAALLALALLFGGWVRRRPKDVDPSLAEVPLAIAGLGKAYPGGVAAVQDVSFRVEKGQVLGLLGPNGAGKTTTLRMVMGLITPTAGEIRVFGHKVGPGAPILSRIGSFVEGSGFLPHLSGRANLELYWKATGRPAGDAHLDAALTIAGLGKAVDRRVRTYSQGMRQRLAIAQAMLGLPELLLLDEPTNGLDPPQIHAMREVLRRYAATGRTVLVSSHLLSEVEQTCSHVVVVHLGRTIAAGTVGDLVASSGEMLFTIGGEPGTVDAQRARAADVLADMADDVEITETGVAADLGRRDPALAVAALVSAGIPVQGAAPRNRLEDVFLSLVGASGDGTLPGRGAAAAGSSSDHPAGGAVDRRRFRRGRPSADPTTAAPQERPQGREGDQR